MAVNCLVDREHDLWDIKDLTQCLLTPLLRKCCSNANQIHILSFRILITFVVILVEILLASIFIKGTIWEWGSQQEFVFGVLGGSVSILLGLVNLLSCCESLAQTALVITKLLYKIADGAFASFLIWTLEPQNLGDLLAERTGENIGVFVLMIIAAGDCTGNDSATLNYNSTDMNTTRYYIQIKSIIVIGLVFKKINIRSRFGHIHLAVLQFHGPFYLGNNETSVHYGRRNYCRYIDLIWATKNGKD
ncbi:hypothetical protein CHS0354_027461 [Potamilus streckersoni]|uniref:Uncharacterized protein n=1 Tax=Potamilus streckersoni TaxID=2493646 RepID=A0AAE0T6Y2_9BIVA|nr:hypothetical protein CHS0354_027461 [Potamilus streckersoni]